MNECVNRGTVYKVRQRERNKKKKLHFNASTILHYKKPILSHRVRFYHLLTYINSARKLLPSLLIEDDSEQYEGELQRVKAAVNRISSGHLSHKVHKNYVRFRLGNQAELNNFRDFYKNYDDETFENSHLKVDLFIEGKKVSASVDTLSDACLISASYLDSLGVDWRNAPPAGKLDLRSYTDHKVSILKTVWLKISFRNEQIVPFACKFAVLKSTEKGENSVIFGIEPMIKRKIGIEWTEIGPAFSFAGPSTVDQSVQYVPLQKSSSISTAVNVLSTRVKPNEDVVITFVVPERFLGRTVTITNLSDHSENKGEARNLIIIPSLSYVHQNTASSPANAYAVVRNMSNKKIVLKPSQLRAYVSSINLSDCDYVSGNEMLSSGFSPEEIESYCNEHKIFFTRQLVQNIPSEHDLHFKEYYDGDDVVDVSDIEQIEDRAGLPTDGLNLLVDPVEQIDFSHVDENWRPKVRGLFEKYRHGLSLAPFDCGTSTLSPVFLPLKKPLESKKMPMFHPNARDAKHLRATLKLLERYQFIEKVPKNLAAHASPIFLKKRANPKAPYRFLVALNQVNDSFADAVSNYPRIDKTIQGVARGGLVLASTADVRDGFFAVRVAESCQNRLIFGWAENFYKAKRLLQGQKSSAILFHGQVNEMLSRNPDTEQYEPVNGIGSFADDIFATVSRADCDSYEEACQMHFQQLETILHRISGHGLKLSPQKIQLWRKKITLLGTEIEGDQIRIPKKRIEKMVKLPFPRTKAATQRLLGHLSSIHNFAPVSIHKLRPIITELLDDNKRAHPEKRHFVAFECIKQILTDSDFVVTTPEPTNPFVLVTDASTTTMAAILLSLSPVRKVIKRSKVPPMRGFHPESLAYHINKMFSLRLALGTQTPADGNCFYHALADQVQLLNLKRCSTNAWGMREELLKYLVSCPEKEGFIQSLFSSNDEWHSFIQQHAKDRQPTDDSGIFPTIAASALRRPIHIICENEFSLQPKLADFLLSFYPYEAVDKENIPIWLLFTPSAHGVGHYQSLIQCSTNSVSDFCSLDFITGDLNCMSDEEILSYAKDIFDPKSEGLHTRCSVKVVAYDSKAFSPGLKKRPIHEQEAAAALYFLDQFRDLIQYSVLTILATDSRSCYWLGTGASIQAKGSLAKASRWQLAISSTYPNVIFHFIPSKANIADYLTRVFDVEPSVVKHLNLSKCHIDQISEMEGKTMSQAEVVRFAEANPQYLTEEKKERKSNPSVSFIGRTNTLSRKELSVIDDTVVPISVLRDKLSEAELIRSQREELPFYFDPETRPLNVTLEGEMLVTIGEPKVPVIPPSKIGPALAYVHLIGAHASYEKGLKLLKSYFYWVHQAKDWRDFTRSCATCTVVNPITTNPVKTGEFPLPRFCFEEIFLDLIESVPPNKFKYVAILTIVCGLSGYVQIFPLKSKTTKEVIFMLQIYLSFTGHRTHTIRSDNGTIFRSDEFLSFCTAMKIRVAQSSAFRSQARGKVEVYNKIVSTLFAKMLFLAPDYAAWTRIFSLVTAILNSSFKPSINTTPSMAVFGSNYLQDGPLGLKGQFTQKIMIRSPELRAAAESLQRNIQEQVQEMRNFVVEKRKQTVERRRKRENHGFAVGQIVFVKQFSRRVGENKRFRPALHKSPFIIVSTGTRSITVMRLADGFITMYAPDHLRRFREKDPHLYKNIPHEVLRILGSTLTEEKLLKLAQIDELEPIYKSTQSEERSLFLSPSHSFSSSSLAPSVPVTRSRLQKRRRRLERAIGRASTEVDDDDLRAESESEEEETDTQNEKQPPHTPTETHKQVRFA